MKDNRTPLTRAWLRYTDEGSEGEWKDRWTGVKQNFTSIPWMKTEPNGQTGENCAGVLIELGANPAYPAYDIECKRAVTGTVCQDIKDYFW